MFRILLPLFLLLAVPAVAGSHPDDLAGRNGLDIASTAKTLPLTPVAGGCKAAGSCRDAVIMWCAGYGRADRDGDGIPCENVCRTLEEVEAIKAEIGCSK